MTTKQIAQAIGKTDRAVQKWLANIVRQADEESSPALRFLPN